MSWISPWNEAPPILLPNAVPWENGEAGCAKQEFSELLEVRLESPLSAGTAEIGSNSGWCHLSPCGKQPHWGEEGTNLGAANVVSTFKHLPFST